jgi:hypothetical protein
MVKIDLPEGILNRIMARFKAEQRLLTVKRRLVIFSIGFIGSAVAFVPVFKMVQLEISSSGFLQFFSLLFSDFGTVASYWQNFAMSLLETLPAFSLAVFLTVIFVLLESSKFLARDIKLAISH